MGELIEVDPKSAQLPIVFVEKMAQRQIDAVRLLQALARGRA
jgi:hypothetical protein